MAGDIGPSRGVGRQVAAETAGVVIVGGGPAGAVLAARLASAGVEVVVLERSPSWRWRAGGVFASPAAVVALRGAGLAGAVLATVARPIPAMRVETASGTTFRLTYGADAGGEPAVGFDRSRLDPALLDLAVAAGADVRRGWTATASDPGAGRLVARRPDGGVSVIRSPVIVGADGLRSVVARDAGVARPARLDPRVGLTYHLPDPGPEASRDARMRVLRDGYVGIAPVAGGRVNIGIVLGRSWRPALARDGAQAVADAIVAAIPAAPDDPATWRTSAPTDSIAGAWPLGHRVTRRAGAGWLLVGDAAGFLDPFTGEGIHRALVVRGTGGRDDPGAPTRPDGRLRRLRAGDAAPVPRQGCRVVARPGLPRAAGLVRLRRPAGRLATAGPCDDGPRDGRPRSGRPRARPALSRCAPRAMIAADG